MKLLDFISKVEEEVFEGEGIDDWVSLEVGLSIHNTMLGGIAVCACPALVSSLDDFYSFDALWGFAVKMLHQGHTIVLNETSH